jgi:hypothetical protein
MRFAIQAINGEIPALKYGPSNPARRELECFVPDFCDWRQLNYGQGEGQVEIEGREWGFYYGSGGEISVYLHSGQMDPQAAFAFVRDVANKIVRGKVAFRIVLIGTAE